MLPKPMKLREVRPVNGVSMADLFVGQIGRLQAKQATLMAEMDFEVEQIREQYRQKLAHLEEAARQRVEALKAWASEHPELFDASRTLTLRHGRIGFRLGPPSLRLLRGVDWDAVLERIEARQLPFVRVTKEVDKQALIAHANEVSLSELGVKVTQRDEFFVAPDTATGKREVA